MKCLKAICLAVGILLGVFMGCDTVSAKEYTDATMDSVIEYDDTKVFYNFYSKAICGICDYKAVDMETDYGFELEVLDEDTVAVSVYNNTTDDIKVAKLKAEFQTKGYTTTQNKSRYEIKGFRDCPDGMGLVTVTFDTNKSLSCGIFKDGNRLLAANIGRKASAENEVNERLMVLNLMKEVGYDETNALSTEDICYPIMPVAKGEKTDVSYWSDKSFEIVKENWSDAKKVYAFYDWMIRNLAYDKWIVSEGGHNRWGKYKDYTGKYYTSQTGVGVCEDFSQIFAIMCRTQNIPALCVCNGSHAWSVVYLEDYGRWVVLDITSSIQQNCYSEDTKEISASGSHRYEGLVKRHSGIKKVYIGNLADIAKQKGTKNE